MKRTTVVEPTKAEEDEELWTVADAAQFLKVSKDTVATLALSPTADRLPSHKIGASRRYSPSEVKRWALSRRH